MQNRGDYPAANSSNIQTRIYSWDPVAVATYAQGNGLLKTKGWMSPGVSKLAKTPTNNASFIKQNKPSFIHFTCTDLKHLVIMTKPWPLTSAMTAPSGLVQKAQKSHKPMNITTSRI